MLKAVVKVRSQARRRRAKDLIRRHLKRRRSLQCRPDLPWLDFIDNWRRTYTFFCQLEAVQISRSRPSNLPFFDRPQIKFACKESGARDDCVKCPKNIWQPIPSQHKSVYGTFQLHKPERWFNGIFRSTRLDICQREGVPYLGNAVEYLKNLRRARTADWNVFRSWFVVVSSLERSQSSPATQYHGLQTATGSYFLVSNSREKCIRVKAELNDCWR